MRRWLAVVALLLTAPLAVWAGNTLGTGQEPSEREQAMGAMQGAYIASGCLPTLPGGSLSFGAFACTGFVHDTTVSPPRLKPVVQVAKALGPLNDGNGTYWLALHKDTSTAASGWTREPGTHYLWRFSGSQPATPVQALLFASVTVSGGGITALQDLRISASYARTGAYDFTDPLYGGLCNGVTDTTVALQHVLDHARPGSRVTLPSGVCLLSATLTITRPLHVEGAGMNHTILRQTVADIPVLRVGVRPNFHVANNVHLSKFTADHSGTPIAGGDGVVIDNLLNRHFLSYVAADRNWNGFVLGCVAFGEGANLEANNNNSHGFAFVFPADTCGAAQWSIHHSLSQLNKGAGFSGTNTASANGIGPFLDHTHAFGNDQGGYVFVGTPGHPINNVFLLNVLSSADNLAGISLDTYGTGHLISNPWIELTGQTVGITGFPIGAPPSTSVSSNTGHCLAATVNNLPGVAVIGGNFWNCAWSGVALYAPYSSLTGGASIGNGRALDADLSRRAGVAIGATGVLVSGHVFNYSSTETAHYIHLTGVLDDLSIGANTYAPALPVSAIMGATAFTPAGRYSAMAGGLTVHTNTPTSPALLLVDAALGATPLKFLSVTEGKLQILNAAATAIIHTLSDVGTPAWPNRRGQVSVENAETTKTVTLAPVEPDTTYFVQLTPVQTGGTPAAGAYTITNVTKATGTFQISVSTAPGGGNSVIYDWLVYR